MKHPILAFLLLWILGALPSVGWTKPQTLKSAIAPLSPSLSQDLPSPLDQEILTDFQVGVKGLSFVYKGYQFQILIHETTKKTLSLNGRVFSSEQLKDVETVRTLLAEILKKNQKGWNVSSFFIGPLYASTTDMTTAYRSYDFMPLRPQGQLMSLDQLKNIFSSQNLSQMTDLLSNMLVAVNQFAFGNEALNDVMMMPSLEAIPKPSFMTR